MVDVNASAEVQSIQAMTQAMSWLSGGTQPEPQKEVVRCPQDCGWHSEDEGPELNQDQSTLDEYPYKCPRCGIVGRREEFGI